ncbi:RNA polymerase sigma factor [Enterococcus sp. HY326]|uniref:RNA polymerase sigma factor n=1 Tax=Enterococcus sp. HY326 TaxID=2971265 RepID=UPI00223FBEE3|nr:sigma-70 family RNA polymerase sigma factor [Enterococcus sp. HY326]
MESSQLELLYQLYAKELFLYARSFTKDNYGAEELVSDAFFQLALQEVLPENLKFWLFAVVKHRFIDMTRKSRRWQLLPLEKAIEAKSPLFQSADEQLLQKENYQQLYQAINDLKPPQSEIILLFYFLHWSTADIAQYLGLKPGQVRVMLHRSRHKLKGVLTDDGKVN